MRTSPQRKRLVRHCIVFAITIVATLFFTAMGNAQTAGTGSIQGLVTDATGAVIPNATVISTNTATHVQIKTISDGSGLYSFPNLPVGEYDIDVFVAGFKHYVKTGIVLEVGSSIAVNAIMSLGRTTEEVEVKSDGLALQTEDPSFKQTVDQHNIMELPLNGRQVTSLITISGAAVSAAEGQLVTNKNFYSAVAIAIAGGLGDMTNYRLDGGDNNDYLSNVNLPFPFPDAVSQFSVESSVLGAQYGLHPGGLVNVVTRSGSNQFHGDAFEFIRNNFIDATNFFADSKDQLHQNQFGGTLGGPILRNRLFVFGGYQRLILHYASSKSIAYVPTPANLQGDFSVTDGAGCTSSGKAVQLVNPQTGAALSNNQISPTYFNSSALALEKYLPATTSPCGEVNYAVPSIQDENQFITRVDETINHKNSLYARYFLDGYTSPAFYSPTNILVTSSVGEYERVQSLTFGETYTINARTVNLFHATGMRKAESQGTSPDGINPSTIGINTYIQTPTYFDLGVTGKFTVYGSDTAPAYYDDNTFSFADDLNMVRGRHEIVLGGEYVRNQLNISSANDGNGDYTFSGIYSEKGPTGSGKLGTGEDANLDFLTGSMSAFTQDGLTQNAYRGPMPSLYAQDTYHAAKRLVLTGGLRWEPDFMPVDVFNRGATFSLSGFLANTRSGVYPTAPAGVSFYGDPGVSRTFTRNWPWLFSPNVGISYDPYGTGKTVIRAGAELGYDELDWFSDHPVTNDDPFDASVKNTPVNVPLSFSAPWSNGTVTSDPFPIAQHPTASTASFPKGSKYVFYAPDAANDLPYHPTRVTQWTASIQQEFGSGWQFQIQYIGNKGIHEQVGFAINPAIFLPGTCSGAPCSTVGNEASRFALTRDNPTQGPQFAGGGSGVTEITSGANSNYNALVTSIQHRMSSTFSFLANYTWSHCIDIKDARGQTPNVQVEDPNDFELDRASCDDDYRNLFNSTVVAVSKLPLSGWRARAFNGWELAPILQITSGATINVTSGIDNSLTDIGNDRPNLVNPGMVYNHTPLRSASPGNMNYLNSAAFTQVTTLGTYGNIGRNSLRGFANVSLNSGVSRFFQMGERLKLDLRFEGFNVLNHPNFGNPASELSSSTFGQVTTSGAARVFQLAAKIIF